MASISIKSNAQIVQMLFLKSNESCYFKCLGHLGSNVCNSPYAFEAAPQKFLAGFAREVLETDSIEECFEVSFHLSMPLRRFFIDFS